MEKNNKIFVVGGQHIVKTALLKYFKENGFLNIVTDSSSGVDVMDQKSVSCFFKKDKPEYVFLLSAKSGGIMANSRYPAEFIYANLESQNNIIHSSYVFGVKKLLFLGSCCIYPCNCPQPISEEYLLGGKLEQNSQP